jgi:hypothetical protein
MAEVFENLDHVPTWHAALRVEPPDWNAFLGDYSGRSTGRRSGKSSPLRTRTL